MMVYRMHLHNAWSILAQYMVAFVIESHNLQLNKIDEHSVLLKLQYTCRSG